MADFIYNRAYKSGGKWHLVEGEVTFTTIPASERRFSHLKVEGEGETVRITPEHRIAKAKVRCGVASDSWRGQKFPITTGDDHRDDWSRAYARWRKDKTQDLVITEKYTPPLVVLDAEEPPEPFCGNCVRIMEKEARGK